MKNENMKLWDAVKTIDPKYTLQANVSGQRITSYSLASVVMMATEQFGKWGKSWGYEVEAERFDEGVIIQPGCTHENGDITPEVKQVTHTLLLRLWYMDGSDKVVCPLQAGHTPYIRKTKYGPSCDEEYYKKTLADAIKKSMSMLGFGADIYLGLMDDQGYQQVMEEERALRQQAERPAQIEAFGAQVVDWCESYKKINMGHSLQAAYQSHAQQTHSTCAKLGIKPDVYLTKLETMYNTRLKDLKKAAESK